MQGLKILIVVTSLLSGLVLADNTTQINLSGTLLDPPPCTINDGAPIVVDFGDSVGISRVDGVNYTQTVDYHIRCDKDPNNNPWVMGLTIVGAKTTFDGAAIQATIDGSSSQDLGIKMHLGGKYFTLNQRVEVKQPLPVLEAAPMHAPGATLPEGYFHATATLLADYE
ncbi:TPA: fimbrial protein [Klebsiella aerogenes]|nr:fimbrial protein [Klebsiella aerogenes]